MARHKSPVCSGNRLIVSPHEAWMALGHLMAMVLRQDGKTSAFVVRPAVHVVLKVCRGVGIPMWEAHDEVGHYCLTRYLATEHRLPPPDVRFVAVGDEAPWPLLYYVPAALPSLSMQHGRQVTIRYGGVVRTHLSEALVFRTGRGPAVSGAPASWPRESCVTAAPWSAVVSPDRATLDDVRNMVRPDRFAQALVNASPQVREQRDIRGAYARARRADIKGLAGIDDPYVRHSRCAVLAGSSAIEPPRVGRR